MKRTLRRAASRTIYADMQADPIAKDGLTARAGYRSVLRVPIRVSGELAAALDFSSFQTSVYTVRNVLIAKRIADHVALALSHHRLAEEAQRTIEARERATKLERRVRSLTSELESLGGHRRMVGQSPAWQHALKQATQVFEIRLPPLRERPEDVLLLTQTFLEEIGKAFGRPPAGISREVRNLLLRYHWPGNVRQLRNTLERAAILCQGGLITGEHLSLPVREASTPPVAKEPSRPVKNPDGETGPTGELKSVERAMIEQALRDARQNRSKAAKILGLTRSQLYVRLKKHGLE